MKIRELNLLESKVSTEPKNMVQTKSADLPELIGKSAFNSLIKHPWMNDIGSYEKAWKHGVDSTGFHKVEVYPYFPDIHKTPDGKIRPTLMYQFTISHFGGKGRVIQCIKYVRDEEPDENEKRYGPSAGWKHVKSWKTNIDESVISELKKSKFYPKPLGMMEMYKFVQVASTEQKIEMKKLIAMGKQDEAWKLLQDVTGTRLSEEPVDEAEKRTPASIEIRQNLKKSGYKLLGSGVDATVWAKKAGPVIKIIMPDDGKGAGIAGDTFMKFYEFCKEHPGYENLPKFSDNEVEVFQADGKDYIMATMERLSPIPRGSFEEAIVWIFSDLATKNIDWDNVLRTISSEETWLEHSDLFDPEKMLQKFDSLDDRDLLELEVLYKLMVLLWHRGKINKVGWDLHTENAMMRNGTIVITDPWFSLGINKSN